MALARAERNRRSAPPPRRGRARQFALLPEEHLAEGLRRMALEQVDYTIELLEGREDGPSPAVAMHEMRKSLKRLRALIRLLQAELGESVFAREDRVLREAGLRLAGARDAEVIVDTLEGLLDGAPRKLVRRRGVMRLRARLQLERDRAEEQAMSDLTTRLQVLEELRSLRSRIAGWRLSERRGIRLIEPGIRDTYRRGRRRYWLVAGDKGGRALAMHRWRKRVKDLRYAVELLDRREPGERRQAAPAHGPRGRGFGIGTSSERIRSIAREADELAELLGADHDLVLLRTRIQQRRPRSSRAGRRTRKALLKQIRRRRRRLRKRALRRGARLYRRSPKMFVRELADAHGRS